MEKYISFIEEIINHDLETGKVSEVQTRFPPEPNGYLHIGHAKSLCINFGVKEKYKGKCFLRFDDTNPLKEDEEYVNSIMQDIKWLGFEWDELRYGSDYFEKMFECAVKLINKGMAYVCDLTADEIKASRGTLHEAGKDSPYRTRPAEENLDLFMKMREGAFKEGEKVLRAKIDMASPNINMRDPVLYRIIHSEHHNTGNKWRIYPMYDFAHPLEDAIEGTTHSICTLEFEDHRPLYDWFIKECEFSGPHPQQIEFARLNITNTIMSKRFLKRLVDEGKVDGWDDPRMPTLCGMRRRGYPPEAIRDFCERVGVAKANSVVEYSYLESCIRDNLNITADRRFVVTNPIKVILKNLPDEPLEEAENNPNNSLRGSRTLTISDEIYIDGSDFELCPPPKYHRLYKGGSVRLKGAYIVTCEEVVCESSKPVLLYCNVVPNSKSGNDNSGMKVKGVIQWVNAADCVPVVLREIFPLLNEGEEDFTSRLNENSIVEYNALAEKSLSAARIGERFQFMRIGYYTLDKTSENGRVVFNEIVPLKDSYNK